MRVRWMMSFVALILLSGVAMADEKNTEAAKLHAIFDAEWEYALEEFPTFATMIGDSRYNDRLTDLSMEAIERRRRRENEVLARLSAIDRSKLSPGDQLNLDLYIRNTRQEIEGEHFPEELIQITQMGGVHQDLAELAQIIPRSSVKDFEDFIKRLRATPMLVDQTIALLRKGAGKGVTPPKVTLREVAKLIQTQVVEDPVTSPIYTFAFDKMPDTIPSSERDRLRKEGAKAIAEAVVPAYRKLHAFWIAEYEPKSREAVGMSALPDGKAWYDYRIKVMTTTDLTAEQIHQIGLSEVKRIRAEMVKIKDSTGFKGDLPEFFTFLRSDPQFYFTDEQSLLMTYRDIAKRIDPELPRLFGRLPRLTYGVIPVPEYSAKTQTTAYYNSGSLEAGRPGYFYANTYDLKSRPKWEMEALTVHEAVPGHHLQISIAQELGDVPRFRRFGGYTAFVEGWGLYSESLGPELGLYKDPYSKFGQLTYEMWRAVRLVVDTGMHSKGWTRQQAIDYFKANAGKTEHDIIVEIDRYIVWPGQALAYKLGELKIKELRAFATRELGDRFSIREFHDEVLGSGALPLSILEERVKGWVKEKKESKATK